MAMFPDTTTCVSFGSETSFNLLNKIFSDDNMMTPYEFGAHTFLLSDKHPYEETVKKVGYPMSGLWPVCYGGVDSGG